MKKTLANSSKVSSVASARKTAITDNPSPEPVAVPAQAGLRTGQKMWSWRKILPAVFLLGCAGAAFALWGIPVLTEKDPPGMVWIPAGEFTMGTDKDHVSFKDAQPRHKVYVDGFWMDKTEVTNAEFARFVEATGYKTVAERTPKPEDFPVHLRPHLKPEMLVAGSLIFKPKEGITPPDGCFECLEPDHWRQWWEWCPGANWRHPEGPGSDIKDRMNYPVVHVSWEDAMAYAEWAGKSLPTEAQWERAARGGVEGQPFYWGKEMNPDGKWMANTWQGKFPIENKAEDGHERCAPVASYPPNAYGLYDMSGNVWEWCSDFYQADTYEVRSALPKSARRNPTGPFESVDPCNRGERLHVMRGGSFLCADNYCVRYQAGARHHGEVKTGQLHTGFRCVLVPKKK